MENSFKKNYDINKNTDGSISINYKAQRRNRHALIAALSIPLFIPSCGLGLAGGIQLFGSDSHVGPIILAIVLGLLVTIFILKAMIDVKETLTIVPNQGIKFNKNKTLPFRDITRFGVLGKQMAQQIGEAERYSHVFAEYGGKEIALTKDIPDALASVIFEELEKFKREAQ